MPCLLYTSRASGRITARVWKSASAVLSGTQTQSIRTGRSMQRMVIACPFYRYALQAEPEYLTAETEAERLYPIAAWLPIWVERQTIYEVALEENPRDEQALQHESGRLAMQKLLTFCGGSDEIIDKWLDYSMIAVSYTHLDVYKRKVTGCSTSARHAGQQPRRPP